MTKSGKPRSRTRWRAWPSRPHCRGEARTGTAFKGRARSDRWSWLSSLRRFRDRRLGPRERHASVSLQGLPKDVHSVDGDALVRIALQGSLDRSGASLDLRKVHREGGGALRDRSHDGVPVASSISFRSQPRQAEVSIGNSRGGRDIHSGNSSRVSIKVSLDPRANEEARPSNAACRRNKSPSSSRATEPAPHSTRSYRGSTQSV